MIFRTVCRKVVQIGKVISRNLLLLIIRVSNDAKIDAEFEAFLKLLVKCRTDCFFIFSRKREKEWKRGRECQAVSSKKVIKLLLFFIIITKK